MTAEDVMADVYFQADYNSLHARPYPIDEIRTDSFVHCAAVRPIPDAGAEDLETPWGYGGPAGRTVSDLTDGLRAWRERQRKAGRVAEFVRFHPFVNPAALWGHVDVLLFDRPTVLVDLRQSQTERWNFYSDSTRNCFRRSERLLTVRHLHPDEWPLFKELYDIGLQHNSAASSYWLDDNFFARLLARSWCVAWVAEDAEGPVAVACFLHTTARVAHYHLAGSIDRGRTKQASYLLLETAFRHYSALGTSFMHLGGGRQSSENDPLYKFKSKFSPMRAGFYVGGLIHDRDAYARLGGGTNDAILGYRNPDRHPPSKLEAPVLRPAQTDDFTAYFRLKSDPDNIAWTGHREPPRWDNLSRFFAAALSERQKRIYIVEAAHIPIGYAYADDLGGSFETAIGIDSRHAGQKAGRTVIAILAQTLAVERSAARIEAWIYPGNMASIRAYESAGFVRDGSRPPRQASLPLIEPKCEMHCWLWRGAEASVAA